MKRHIAKWLVMLACLLLLPMSFAWAAEPGSQGDPLVTRSWVDQYIEKTFAPLEEDLDHLATQLSGDGPTIFLWIGNKTAKINDKEYALDAAPYIEDGRTMVPLRFVGEATGAKFAWDNTAKVVTYTRGTTKVEMKIGVKKMLLNGEEKVLDAAATLQNGRVMVPVRVITEAFQAKVTWQNEEKKVEIH